jgi:ferredoxin-NADP reductase
MGCHAPLVVSRLRASVSALAVLRRDLTAVAGSLLGRPSVPVAITTTPPRAPAPVRHPLLRVRVMRVIRETPDAVTLVLEDPTGAPFEFAAGQFFTLHVRIGGETHKRAYSASSSALEKRFVSVTVKRIAGGKVSAHLVDHAREGDELELLGPSGSFGPSPVPATQPRRLVLVGGGSGITPLASIARTVLVTEPRAEVALVYGNRALGDVIFRDALDELAARCAPRFAVRHVLELPPDGWTGGTGQLGEGALARELDSIGPTDLPTEYLLCGPAPMMRAARSCLEARGVPADRVREERFVSAHAPASAGEGAPQLMSIRIRGGVRECVVAPGQTVLEAALAAGIDLPYSCSVGGCGTCLVRLSGGHVTMDEPNRLSDGERAAGCVLACVSRPSSPCTLEVP